MKWAEEFRESHNCSTCPFVINAVDIGVGTIYDCDAVCTMSVHEILGYMEGMTL